MKLFLAGINQEKDNIVDEIVNKDKDSMLISYEAKSAIDRHKNKFDLFLVGPEKDNIVDEIVNKDKDKFDLFLGGAEPFGRETIKLYLKDENALFSYSRKNDVERAMKTLCKSSKLFIDSGAFTAWTKGKQINVDEYINFINQRADFIYLYGQIDFIPGNRVGGIITSEMVREAAEKTWQNYLYMRPKMRNPYGLLYTFHVGEPFEYLKQALEWKDENGDYIPYMALGGMVGKSKDTRDAFLEKCFNIIKKSSNPNIKIHAFGMTDFDLLEKYPITSADSTSWIMTGATGMIKTDFGNIIVSDFQKNDPSHYSHLPKQAQKIINEEIKEFGFTLDDLKESRDNRIILNAKYMMKKASNLIQKEYKPKKKLF